MKNLKPVVFLLLCVMFVSCDKNKSKVEEIANQFVEAVAAKDKVVINDLYPNAKTYDVLQIVKSIKSDEVEIEFNEKEGVYTAKLNDKQSLIVKVTGENDVKIFDSFGILKLDPAAYELAAKTSAPINKQSDMTNGKLFSDDGDFIQYLAEQYPDAANGNLYESNRRYFWSGGMYPSVDCESPITNGGDIDVKGSDYSIEYIYSTKDTGERVGTETIEGVDIAGGETQVVHVYKNNLYYYANQRNLTWETSFKFKNASTATMLARYGSFTGKEYDEFVKAQSKAKKSK